MIFVKISQNFIKSPLKFWFISQISVHSLWHVWVNKYLSSIKNGLETYSCTKEPSASKFNSEIDRKLGFSTVLPAKSDNDVIFCLQVLSKTLTCTLHLS